jgi:hypothetical protein
MEELELRRKMEAQEEMLDYHNHDLEVVGNRAGEKIEREIRLLSLPEQS